MPSIIEFESVPSETNLIGKTLNIYIARILLVQWEINNNSHNNNNKYKE